MMIDFFVLTAPDKAFRPYIPVRSRATIWPLTFPMIACLFSGFFILAGCFGNEAEIGVDVAKLLGGIFCQFLILEGEPRAEVRVRDRRNEARERVNEAAIRIRIVVRTANDTAPGTRYLFEFISFCCLLSLCLPEIDHLKRSISLWLFPFSRFRLFQMYPQQSQYPH